MCRATQALPGSRDDGARMYGVIVRVCDKCRSVWRRLLRGGCGQQCAPKIKGPAHDSGSGTF